MKVNRQFSKGRVLVSLFLVVHLLAPAGVFAQGARRASSAGGRQSSSPLAWPQITQQNKPWTRWWWLGNVAERRELTEQLEEYERAGLGGVEITPIYGIRGYEGRFVNFLSPAWVDLLEHSLREAGRLRMGVDMATGTGWPFGGPWVGEGDAPKYFALKSYSVRGGGRLGESVRYVQKPLVRAVNRSPDIKDLKEPVSANENLQALALDQVRFEKPLPLQTLMAYSDRGETLDLTNRVGADGRLDWVAPAGDWKLYALFQGWHGKLVERAAPGGEGNVIDHFNEAALDNYLKRFDRAFAGRDLRRLRAFFNDSYEVDDAQGQADWTPRFFEEFRARRGYDLRMHLPALAGDASDEEDARVIYDLRETISELLLERFTIPWRRWAAGRGKIVRNQGHGSPANILDLYAASDIPETEGTDVVRMKFVSSAANVTGKPLSSAEAATWLNEHFSSSLGDVKRAVDLYFLGGVNHVVYHGTPFSPAGEEWPGRLFYAAVHFGPTNSFWQDFPALNRYIARTQSFLQSGRPDNDVLLYYPIHDLWSVRGKEVLVHVGGGHDVGITQGDARALLDAGYAFDLVSDKQLAGVRASAGALQTAGHSYKVIVMPESRFVPLETFRKLFELARGGATVVVRKGLPSDVPGWHNLAARRAELKRLTGQLSFADAGDGVRSAKVGAGRFLLGDDIKRLLAHARVRREAMVDQGLHFARRVYPGGSYYFVLNQSAGPVDGWVPLQTGARSVAVFDPLRERAGLATTRASANGSTEVYLQLAPGESVVLKTFNSSVRGPGYEYFKAGGEPRPLRGNWSVRFDRGGPELPPPVERTELGSWTEYGGDAVRKFSGTATYSHSFNRPAGWGGDWLLDLGNVADSARIKLNGKDLGTLIMSPFRVRIPGALLRDRNTLEVAVSNLMANRIADMDRRGVKWKRFYNINFPARKPENRGEDGLFTAARWPPRDSGLLGPVTLTPLEVMRF